MTKWAAHVIGPDEYHAFPSREAAEDWALKMNALLVERSRKDSSDLWPICWAVPTIWPWDAESHDNELAKQEKAA